jgi:uncharacterized protein
MVLLLAASAALAVEIPRLQGPVMDRAQLLSPEQQGVLAERLARYQQETGHQIVVHTTPSLEGLDIESYAIAVAEAWKVGRAELDDGVILTIAPSERRARIDVGYGLEGVIPDALASRIIRDTLIPAFQQGRMAEGIDATVQSLMLLASGERLPPPPRSRKTLAYPLLLMLFLGLYVLAQALGSGSRGRRRDRPWYLPPSSGAGRSGGGFRRGGFGGGFGGGGGFSGGGGRFGGGGASGSW